MTDTNWKAQAETQAKLYRQTLTRAKRAEKRAEAAEAELENIRTILASTDLGALPNDYPTSQMAMDRMMRIKDLTLDGLTQIARWEKAEARVKKLESRLTITDEMVMHAVKVFDKIGWTLTRWEVRAVLTAALEGKK